MEVAHVCLLLELPSKCDFLYGAQYSCQVIAVSEERYESHMHTRHVIAHPVFAGRPVSARVDFSCTVVAPSSARVCPTAARRLGVRRTHRTDWIR